MDLDFVLYIFKQTIYISLLISAPMLVVGLIVGLAVSIFQAVTQIQEMTLSFIPKILSIAGVMILFLPWIIRTMLEFTRFIFEQIGNLP